jgi:hypothetical protein
LLQGHLGPEVEPDPVLEGLQCRRHLLPDGLAGGGFVDDDHDTPGPGMHFQHHVQGLAGLEGFGDPGEAADSLEHGVAEKVDPGEYDRNARKQGLPISSQEIECVVVGGDDGIEAGALVLVREQPPQVGEVNGVGQPLGVHVLDVQVDGASAGGQHFPNPGGLAIGPVHADMVGIEQQDVRLLRTQGPGWGAAQKQRDNPNYPSHTGMPCCNRCSASNWPIFNRLS